ncbi:MAG: 2-amino-4-oxopentanoate thiolase subunit OrtA [Candidatus Sumerlaeaceae bacterium]|nr:2-amino-4-oxopentanoate thiolase subunit OrtA [Candidatus Sumerlaeaceae bacterium]
MSAQTPLAAGDWVEIEAVVLRPEERSPAVPADTKATPLVMRVNGFLQADATVGSEAIVLTRAGRILRGTLRGPAPAYSHTFGEPVAELIRIGPLLRAILASPDESPDPVHHASGGRHGN